MTSNNDLSQFPPGSMLSQLVMDIYADQAKKTVTILYDRALTEELLGLHYHEDARELLFEFAKGKLPFGITLNDPVHNVLITVDTVTLLHYHIDTQTALSGMDVPLNIIK